MSTPSVDIIIRQIVKVTIGLALIETVILAYSVHSGRGFSGIFIFPGLLGAYFLRRGTTTWLRRIRNSVAVVLGGLLALPVIFVMTQPWDLIMTTLRVSGVLLSITMCLYLGVYIGSLIWILWRLNFALSLVPSPLPLHGHGSGMRRLIVSFGIIIAFFSASVHLIDQQTIVIESTKRAMQILGADYQYHVGSINYRATPTGKHIRTVVTAWSHDEIKKMPIDWEEE